MIDHPDPIEQDEEAEQLQEERDAFAEDHAGDVRSWDERSAEMWGNL